MLAAEALRIKYAALYYPMGPCPPPRSSHSQIRAVYEQMLPQPPFLLADDPGAGKTIMRASTKEMMLRPTASALVVAPGDWWISNDELHTKFGLSFEVLTAS